MNARLPLVAVLGLLAVSVLVAQSTPGSTLLALSKRDRTLAIIDPAGLRVLATIPVGDDPHEVIASADGRTAYVSNYGFGSLHTLTAVDLVAQKAAGTIELGALRGPHGLVVAQDRIWFTAEAAKAVGRYDPAAKAIDWIMGTGQDRTHMLVVSEDGSRIVTTNVNAATVTVMEKVARRSPPSPPAPPGPSTGGAPGPPPGQPPPGAQGPDWQLTVIPVGRGAEGLDVSPDGKEAWVANAADGTVSIVDLRAKTVAATLAVDVRGANRLKFTPDGGRALVSMGAALVVLDAATRAVVKRLDAVHATGGIQVQPDGARAYVACGREDKVVVVDLGTLEPVGTIENIGGPDGLGWAVRR